MSTTIEDTKRQIEQLTAVRLKELADIKQEVEAAKRTKVQVVTATDDKIDMSLPATRQELVTAFKHIASDCKHDLTELWKVVQEWADEAFEKMGLDTSTAVVTLTHDPKLDDPALEAALRSDVFYVGALGSKRTHAKRKERLSEAGISDEQFARIHGPIGLNIGAKSPAEIAVSILGQIIEARARRLEALSAPKVAAA